MEGARGGGGRCGMKRGLKRPRINPDVWAEDVREWENCPPATYGESISRKCNIVFKGYEK